MRSTRSLTSLSLSSSASHQMTWCGVRGVAAFQPRPRNEKPGAVSRAGLGRTPEGYLFIHGSRYNVQKSQVAPRKGCIRHPKNFRSPLNRLLRGLVPSYSRPAHLLRSTRFAKVDLLGSARLGG